MSIKIGDVVSLKEIDPDTFNLAKGLNVFFVCGIMGSNIYLSPIRNQDKVCEENINSLTRLNKFRKGDSIRYKKSEYNTNQIRRVVKVKGVNYNPSSGHVYIETSISSFPNESSCILKKRAK